MKGKKTKTSDKKKVIKAKLENPEASTRDIEKKTGVSKSTVAKTISDLPESVRASMDMGKKMLDDIDSIISDVVEITMKSLTMYKKMPLMTVKDTKGLNDIAEINFKRKQLLTGKPTENVLSIDLTDKTTKQIEELRKQML